MSKVTQRQRGSARTPVWQPNPRAPTASQTLVCKGASRAHGFPFLYSAITRTEVLNLGHHRMCTAGTHPQHSRLSRPGVRPVNVLSSSGPRRCGRCSQETMPGGAPIWILRNAGLGQGPQWRTASYEGVGLGVLSRCTPEVALPGML